MSAQPPVSQKRVTAPEITARKGREPIVSLTSYHAHTAAIADPFVDFLLVGDSLGMVMHGYETTVPVPLDLMIMHGRAVVRGSSRALVVVDMPFGTYEESPSVAFRNAARVMKETDCGAVKLEGGTASRQEAIRQIVDCEVPVCGHIGLTPQSVYRFGGFRVQGKTPEAHEQLLRQAVALEKAGIFMLVLEGIPEELAREITAAVKIPTIGIGAGRYVDGQVLVYHDLLGHSTLMPKFVKQYANLDQTITSALNGYCAEVRSGAFPAAEHTYYPITEQE